MSGRWKGATSSPTVTRAAAGKPPQDGSRLGRVAVWGMNYWQMKSISALTFILIFISLCSWFRESTATLLMWWTGEETTRPTSIAWKPRKTHSVGTILAGPTELPINYYFMTYLTLNSFNSLLFQSALALLSPPPSWFLLSLLLSIIFPHRLCSSPLSPFHL